MEDNRKLEAIRNPIQASALGKCTKNSTQSRRVLGSARLSVQALAWQLLGCVSALAVACALLAFKITDADACLHTVFAAMLMCCVSASCLGHADARDDEAKR